MRKFKTIKDNDEKFDKKFEEDLNEIKEKLHAEKLSDEFKANLQSRLEEEFNKTSDKKNKIFEFPKIARNFAVVCTCLIVFFSSCLTFADDIENVILKMFGSTDKGVEEAIEKGNYKKIDMEYVEDNGVSIKVDYVAIVDENLYIAFDVLTEKEFDEIYIKNMKIKDQDDLIVYFKNTEIQGITSTFEEENLNSKNSIVIYNIENEKYKFEDLEKLKIKCDLINIVVDKKNKEQKGNWELEVSIK